MGVRDRLEYLCAFFLLLLMPDNNSEHEVMSAADFLSRLHYKITQSCTVLYWFNGDQFYDYRKHRYIYRDPLEIIASLITHSMTIANTDTSTVTLLRSLHRTSKPGSRPPAGAVGRPVFGSGTTRRSKRCSWPRGRIHRSARPTVRRKFLHFSFLSFFQD